MAYNLNLKSILEIILKAAQKNANILAHRYLLKDESIISKWKNKKAIPRNDDIKKIVEFAQNETTLTQKKIIREKIEGLVRSSHIEEEFKNIILNTQDFGEFLEEALSVSVSGDDAIFQYKKVRDKRHTDGSNYTGKENSGRKYTGTLEFDLIVPEERGSISNIKLNNSDIELKGNVKLSFKSNLFTTLGNLKKPSIIGGVLVWLVLGTIIIYLTNGSPKNNS
ncbi:MAG: hypothetical protein Q8942_14135 [Bacillota bacterium]|nr:hypothetical protein [Bacillota bacterium]